MVGPHTSLPLLCVSHRALGTQRTQPGGQGVLLPIRLPGNGTPPAPVRLCWACPAPAQGDAGASGQRAAPRGFPVVAQQCSPPGPQSCAPHGPREMPGELPGEQEQGERGHWGQVMV